MNIEKAVQSIWTSHQEGDFFPEEWRGKLDLKQAYLVQLGLLDLKIAQGQRQTGWKVGLTADAMREMFGGKEPVFGHLLESGSMASDHTFEFATLRNAMVENEILITIGQDFSGPNATPADARAAIKSIAPAFEIVELRGADMRIDMPLAIADNVSQRAFVCGQSIPLAPELDFGDIRAQVSVNGVIRENVIGRDVIDNQLKTLAWLANALHRYGKRIQAGHRIMSGSFTKPMSLEAGDVFETQFTGVGTVKVKFA